MNHSALVAGDEPFFLVLFEVPDCGVCFRDVGRSPDEGGYGGLRGEF